jgi:hypothetical protein
MIVKLQLDLAAFRVQFPNAKRTKNIPSTPRKVVGPQGTAVPVSLDFLQKRKEAVENYNKNKNPTKKNR